ncbi:hypothetical protein KY290_013635 [Solanum tuberosum]|uniref:Uncharacterized protein n=1 Tax=Solanum tuberosum TaxID=4113 RepID=A0ABQ7VMC2_SOLTU|nr:hypothetical protein KY289_013766 [Solanum tuberosum]KAH0769654.1 hypothetical protein KY290_013635 [Solanum tuberosum]
MPEQSTHTDDSHEDTTRDIGGDPSSNIVTEVDGKIRPQLDERRKSARTSRPPIWLTKAKYMYKDCT